MAVMGVWLTPALLDARCHVLSGEAKTEAGWGRTRSPPPRHTADHWGQHTEVRAMSKGKRRGINKNRSRSPNWGMVLSFLDFLSHNTLHSFLFYISGYLLTLTQYSIYNHGVCSVLIMRCKLECCGVNWC